jgi:hypothetical protein
MRDKVFNPDYEKFAKLTDQEERKGLLDNPISIGTRKNWQQRLIDNNVQIKGHRVMHLNKLH